MNLLKFLSWWLFYLLFQGLLVSLFRQELPLSGRGTHHNVCHTGANGGDGKVFETFTSSQALEHQSADKRSNGEP